MRMRENTIKLCGDANYFIMKNRTMAVISRGRRGLGMGLEV